LLDRAREYIDVVTPQLVKLTRDLASLPGPSGNEREVADRVETEMRDLGYDLVFRDEIGNVVGIIAGSREGGTVLLHSTLDIAVTTGGGIDAIVDERMYGAGAATARPALAAQVFAGAVLCRVVPNGAGTVVVAATTGGQGGIGSGTRYLLRRTLETIDLHPDVAIIGMPTNLAIRAGHDGWMELVVLVEGPRETAVLNAARAMYQHWRELGSGATLDTLLPPFVEGTKVKARVALSLFRAVAAGTSVGEATAMVCEEAQRIAAGQDSVAVSVYPRITPRRFYTGLTSGVAHVCEPWVASRGVSPALVEHSRSALFEAGWTDVDVGPWVPPNSSEGTVGGQLCHEHRVPTIAFGPGGCEDGGGTPSIAIADLCNATFADVAITRHLIEFIRAGELHASPA
jgi:acetylornithine deacetylase/succinyl-diaminopimelate desuccinylase-like protein